MKRKSSDNSAFISEQARLFPRETDFEKSILRTLLLEPEAYDLVSNILKPESFYDKQHELLFAAIRDLHDTKSPASMIDAVQQLRKRGDLQKAGGASYISEITTQGIADIREIEHRARIVAQKHIARELITLAADIQERAFDETQDVSDTLEFIETRLTEITMNRSGSESIEISEAVSLAIQKAAQIQEDRQKGISNAIPTGIDTLTRELYGGWKAPDLIILAARPSMGKTQLAIHFAKEAAQAGKEILFISLEMTALQLVNRLLLEDDRISAYNLAAGQMSQQEWEALGRQAGEIYNLKLRISDNPLSRELSGILSEARRLKRKGKLDMIIIDYLGYILTGNQKFERRQLEIARITGALKSLAKELDVPIMLLCQLNRPEKGISIREPQLHDLRESGDIEQDADIVLFIHRPSYYDKDKYPEWEGRGEIIIGKYREGMRSQAVNFYHDKRFKKIWGEEKQTNENARLRNFYEPARKEEDEMPF
ncbi:MAG: replicative DNA helicase [Dysgonamonadaceae bacterium]|jgi:replicative DNA helicase|nr:replicative DNA helicase [Dysgonamonadaceae bacterium]